MKLLKFKLLAAHVIGRFGSLISRSLGLSGGFEVPNSVGRPESPGPKELELVKMFLDFKE